MSIEGDGGQPSRVDPNRGNEQPSRRRRFGRRSFLGIVWLALVPAIGCERMPPVTSAETMHLLTALRTACSAQRPEALEDVRQRVEEAWEDQRLTEAEYKKIVEIIEMANGGDWEAAEQACFRFQKASSG